MEILKKLILFLFLVTIAEASLEDILRQNSFDASGVSSLKSQTRGYYNFGGLAVRHDFGSSIRPFNITMPSVRSGCGGIDLLFGGFSFLNLDALVEKLQKVASAAPAFIFNMALSALCKDCQTILAEIEGIVDSLNSLNFDGCKAAVNWGKAAGSWLSNHMASSDDPKLSISTWASGASSKIKEASAKISDQIGTVQSYLDGTIVHQSNEEKQQKTTEKRKAQGSLLKKLFRDNKKFTEEMVDPKDKKSYAFWMKGIGAQDFEALLRNMVGDLYGYIENPDECLSGNEEEGVKSYRLAIIPPRMSADEAVAIFFGESSATGSPLANKKINGLYLGKEKKLDDCGKGHMGKPDIAELREVKGNFGAKSIRNGIYQRLENMARQISEADEEFKDSIPFLNAIKYPVYKALNVLAISNDSELLQYITDYIMASEIHGVITILGTQVAQAAEAIPLTDTIGGTQEVNQAQERILHNIRAIQNKSVELAERTAKKMEARVEQVQILEDFTTKAKMELLRQGLFRNGK